MPKISIKTLPLDPSIDIPGVLKMLGTGLAHTLNIGLDQLVILWEPISSNRFLFHGELACTQPESSHHPVVEITAIKGMPRDMEKKMVLTLVRILSRELGIDDTNVCVVVNTLVPGKLFVSGAFKNRATHGTLSKKRVL